jgi:hypothetical protein
MSSRDSCPSRNEASSDPQSDHRRLHRPRDRRMGPASPTRTGASKRLSTIVVPARVSAIASLFFSALTWHGVLAAYVWIATWPGDLLVLLLALAAIVYGVLAVVHRVRSPLAWSAFVVSLIFPVWLWQVLSSLPSDAF